MYSVHNNMGSLRVNDALQTQQRLLFTSLERLSTGIRMNRAEDDAAGLMLRDRFRAQATGLEEGIRNIQTAQGMIQVAEQGVNKITDALQQIRALAVRAADDNLTDDDRGRIQNQVRGLLREINERAQRTEYNGHNLLDGSVADARAERQASARVQSNSFLSDGNTLVSGVAVAGNGATDTLAVSQGSYEIRLVHDEERRDNPVATENTILKGKASSGLAYLNSRGAAGTVVSRTENVVDRDGTAVNGNSAVGFEQITITVADDVTATDQSVLIDFAGLTQPGNGATTDLTITAAGATVRDGTPTVPGTTHNASYSAALSARAAVATSVNTSFNWFDRDGVSHNVLLTLTKSVDDTASATQLADTWQYTLNSPAAGVWSAGLNESGAIVFDVEGNVTSVNGVAGRTRDFLITDGTFGDQAIHLDFDTLRNNADPVTGLVGSNIVDGTDDQVIYTNSTDVVFHSRLVDGFGPIEFKLSPIIDRTGGDANNGGAVIFTQVGDSNKWQWAAIAPTTSGYTGKVFGGTGVVEFTDAGNIIGPTTFVATLEDGTPEGHTISFDITNLRMGRLTSLEGTSTDGSEGTGDIQVNAAIYASGTGSVQPLLVLEGVSAGTKSATLGGVTFTVNRATKDDVGLTAFVKAYGYAKGTLEDRALQFQIGAHEGDVTRIGIAKMDVATIFRAGENGYEYSDIELTDKLVAQDLIGQVDDALNFVSGENLRIGAFQNSMSRWLEGQRQQATSITGALSNLEDADMATEATVQSKRSILVQSGMAMLAQANTNHQYLLQLLR